LSQKKVVSRSSCARQKSAFDAIHDLLQVRLSDLVVHLSTIAFTGEEAAPLHQPKMLGRHVIGYPRVFGEFANRVPTMQQHLDHPQPHRVGQRFQTFSGLRKRIGTADRSIRRVSLGF
jgi:hypothetical protein